jgi:hypothetical protein
MTPVDNARVPASEAKAAMRLGVCHVVEKPGKDVARLPAFVPNYGGFHELPHSQFKALSSQGREPARLRRPLRRKRASDCVDRVQRFLPLAKVSQAVLCVAHLMPLR